MSDYIVLRKDDEGNLTDPQVHLDAPDAATAVKQSNPGRDCELVVSVWAPEDWRVRSEPTVERVTAEMREAER